MASGAADAVTVLLVSRPGGRFSIQGMGGSTSPCWTHLAAVTVSRGFLPWWVDRGHGCAVDRDVQSYQMVCRPPGPVDELRALSLLQLAAMVVWWSVEVVMKEE